MVVFLVASQSVSFGVPETCLIRALLSSQAASLVFLELPTKGVFLIDFSTASDVLRVFSYKFLSVCFVALSDIALATTLYDLYRSSVVHGSSIRYNVIGVVLPRFIPWL